MARPVRAGRWVLGVTVVAALLVVGWSALWSSLAPLRERGAGAVGAVELALIFLFLLSGYNVKQRSRRSGGGGSRDNVPHD